MASKVILYSYFRSSASWRVRIALAYKGIEYEYKGVNLLKSEQKSDDYLKTNPKGEVPAIEIDGVTLTQSLPIIEYIEETHPEKPLLPKDPIQRAEVRRLAEMINSGIQPIQNLSVQGKLAEMSGNPEHKAQWANYWIEKGFTAFEKILEKSAGRFCVGDELTIADVCLVPQIYNAKRFKVDMSAFPIISRIVDECEKLDPFIAAQPSNQPDCPADLK